MPSSLQRGIEIRRASDILIRVDAVIPIRPIKRTGALAETRIKFALFLEEMAKPVILRPVLGNGLLHTLWHRNFVIECNDLPGTFDHPGKNALAGVLIEVFAIVLDITAALNLGIEGYDDQPAPDAVIGGTDLRQVVCIEHGSAHVQRPVRRVRFPANNGCNNE